MLICGASFAGLAVARELRGTGARVMVLDRYELGERATSACAAPTAWLQRLDLQGSVRQTCDELRVHTPWTDTRWRLPWSFSTFDYRELCALLWEQSGLPDDAFETAKVDGVTRASERADSGAGGWASQPNGARAPHTVHTDRGELRAPLVVDGLGWRRVLACDAPVQPPRAALTRGLEVAIR